MPITGQMLIGSAALMGRDTTFQAVNPATGDLLPPSFGGGGGAEVERACALAWEAFDRFRAIDPETRAAFLDSVAANILGLGDALIERAMLETGLPRPRLEGERGRTVGQLRLFAQEVRDGLWHGARIDPAQPDRQPLPRADLRQRRIPVGPVAVFGASNFPLAFSVAGGDTASALAAGCPVVVKAHSAHPGTSELVGQAVQAAVKAHDLPEGVFSMLFGSGNQIGTRLVQDHRIKAVGFTGSRSGGVALMQVAAARPEPIPVYAEMSSINPVFLLPAALAARAEQIGKDFAASLTLGAGQFCTNPGLVLGVAGPALDGFIASAVKALSAAPAQTMLTPGIHAAYQKGVDQIASSGKADHVAQGADPTGPNQCRAALFVTDAATFLAETALQQEVFGSSSVVIRCASVAEMIQLAEHLEGQLTATVQYADDDADLARALLPVLERKAGRILFNGYPTGVEVCHAMIHGGPFPATSDPRTTSVGSAAIDRFLRPVCYQDVPAALLPAALQADNPLGLMRRVNGTMTRD